MGKIPMKWILINKYKYSFKEINVRKMLTFEAFVSELNIIKLS